MTSSERFRVVAGSPLPEKWRTIITSADPSVELVVADELLPPQRWPGDHNGDPGFHRTPAQQREFDRLMTGADAWYGLPDVSAAETKRLLPHSPTLRWVHTMAAGGGESVRAAKLSDPDLKRVIFTTSAGVHGTALAEFAVFGVLAGAKDLPVLTTLKSERHWPERWFLRQVREQTVVVVGLGGIGREVARLLKALGATIIGVRNHVAGRTTDVPHVDEVHAVSELPALVARADAIVLALPETGGTSRLFNEELFAVVRTGAVLVNVGRGTTVDEAALVDALTSGRLRSAVLDVTAVEPLPATSPLWELPNVVISPHTAALEEHEDRRIAELFADNLSRLLSGRELRNVVVPGEFY